MLGGRDDKAAGAGGCETERRRAESGMGTSADEGSARTRRSKLVIIFAGGLSDLHEFATVEHAQMQQSRGGRLNQQPQFVLVERRTIQPQTLELRRK